MPCFIVKLAVSTVTAVSLKVNFCVNIADGDVLLAAG